MRTQIILSVLILLILFGCESEMPLQVDNEISPPTQKGEVDLIGFSNQVIEAVAVNPNEPWNIFVSTGSLTGSSENKIYISRDYGINWKVSLDSIRSRCVVWDRRKPNVAYLAKNIRFGSDFFVAPFLLKTDDYGKSWVKLDSGIHLMDKHITTISIDYFDPNYIFLAATANMSDMPSSSIATKGRTFFSSNGGKYFSDTICASLYHSFGSYVLVQDFATSNLKNGLIFAAIISDNDAFDLAISSNFGSSWIGKNIIDNWYSDVIRVFNEMVALIVIDRRFANKYFVRNSSRILISNNFGLSFKMINQNILDYSKVNDLLITPEGYIIVTAYLNSDPSKCVIYLSKDKGETWTQLTSDTDSKTFLAYDHKNKFIYFVKDKENKGLYRIKLQ